ncbi:unnamed protein product [Larinioides sclopetarius]|uniref:Uncharacterized protein n=1 Tax=Larinioides sclopetarius TaxID=280406 RepID=A0AAV2BPY5_9ARAC
MSLLCVSPQNEFILTWNIENSLFEADACLGSPTFFAENLFKTKWSLQLYAKVENDIQQLFCILKRDYEDQGPNFVRIRFQIRLDVSNNSCTCCFSRDMSKCVTLFPNMGLLKKDFLSKGPWTVQCNISMWDDGSQSSAIRCIIQTRTLITNFSRIREFSWITHKLTEDMVVKLNSNSINAKTFTVALRLNISVGNEVTVKIMNLTRKNIFLSGRISVRNKNGCFLYSAEGSITFGNYGNEWDFPFVFSKEMAKRILGCEVQKNRLFLLFEFFIPDGIESSDVEYFSDKIVPRQSKAYVHRNIKLNNPQFPLNEPICASTLVCNNFTTVQTIPSGYSKMPYTKFSQIEEQLKANNNRRFKSTNEVSKIADLTCESKRVLFKDTLVQTTTTDHRRILGEHFSSTAGKISIDVQNTKFSSKRNAAMQTSKIHCKDATSQIAHSYFVKNIGIQVSSGFKDAFVQTSKPEKNTHISSDCKSNKEIQTTLIYCKNASSQTSYSDCARNNGIEGSVISDFKDACVERSVPYSNIPITEFYWESYIDTRWASPNSLKRLKTRGRKPINIRFNKRYIFKPFTRNLETESAKSKAMKFLMTVLTNSKNFNTTPLFLAEDQLERRRSFDWTIPRNEPGNDCCEEMLIRNNVIKNAVESLSNNNESNDLSIKNESNHLLNEDKSNEIRGFQDEDSSDFQSFNHQINSDICQDDADVCSCNFFVLNTARFIFILFVIVLCLSLAFGCYFSKTNSSQVQKQNSVFNSSIYVKSTTFKATFQINISETECDNSKKIIDLDSETLDRFLGFVLSEDIERLQWEKVINVLHIAYRHDIRLLQNRCTSSLESLLSVSNVCEILLIADVYDNVVLKKAAQNFVCFFADEVFASHEWKHFMLYNTQLAAETLNYFSSFKREKYVT